MTRPQSRARTMSTSSRLSPASPLTPRSSVPATSARTPARTTGNSLASSTSMRTRLLQGRIEQLVLDRIAHQVDMPVQVQLVEDVRLVRADGLDAQGQVV